MNIEKLLMAFLVPLAFIACSEVDSLVANAPSGESNALSSSVDEVSASSSSVVFDGSEKVYRGVTFYTVPQSTIHIYELDPVTFDTIRSVPYYGRSSYFNNIGRWGASEIDTIVVDSLSLKSPYVMLSTDYYNRRYNIVDIRESNGFAVDKKTYFESVRALYLMKSGMSFAEAKKQASKEVLESFGFYADLFDKPETENVQDPNYRIYMAFIEDFMKYTTEDTVVAKIEKCGNLTCGTEFSHDLERHGKGLFFKKVVILQDQDQSVIIVTQGDVDLRLKTRPVSRPLGEDCLEANALFLRSIAIQGHSFFRESICNYRE